MVDPPYCCCISSQLHPFILLRSSSVHPTNPDRIAPFIKFLLPRKIQTYCKNTYFFMSCLVHKVVHLWVAYLGLYPSSTLPVKWDTYCLIEMVLRINWDIIYDVAKENSKHAICHQHVLVFIIPIFTSVFLGKTVHLSYYTTFFCWWFLLLIFHKHTKINHVWKLSSTIIHYPYFTDPLMDTSLNMKSYRTFPAILLIWIKFCLLSHPLIRLYYQRASYYI